MASDCAISVCACEVCVPGSCGERPTAPPRRAPQRGRWARLAVTVLGAGSLSGVGLLVIRDAFPAWFFAGAHHLLASLALVLTAALVLAHHGVRRSSRGELAQALALAAAFLFWAANSLWPHTTLAPTFNDAAIALFALDVFLVALARHPQACEGAQGPPSDLLPGPGQGPR